MKHFLHTTRVVALTMVAGASLQVHATGELLVSSEGTHSVKMYDGKTGAYIRDFVLPGSGGLGGPQGITYGPDKNLYVSSRDTGSVLRYNGRTGAFMSVFATTTGLTFPGDINFREGKLYVSQFGNPGFVFRFDALTGAFIDTFAGNVRGADGQAWDVQGNLYVSSFGSNRIAKFNGSTGASMGDFVAPNGGSLSGPLDNLFMANGDLLVASFNNSRVKRYQAVTGLYLGDFASVPGRVQGLTLSPDRSFIVVGDYALSRLYKIDALTGANLGVYTSGGGLLNPNNTVFVPKLPVPAPKR